MNWSSEYRRQQRYWASGLMGEPNTDQERAFWIGWDRNWLKRRPGRRIAQTIVLVLLAEAVVKRGRS